ncbi:glycosyltransferase involved in cell wall biosynthesis [Pseudodesulfovibrio indicus]|uniref:Glycosyltransferase involved in cell wall biosynthesis n=1 Tax=Pseudodesulfovibrio indicus TaxID=1716143 RepID=A0AA94PTC1_9BACT|nr:glycosyltransferase [Pseudodesulfovibrio indicus]TDT85559.1 glycosyltransferase involved in cell wall biosynthesis [Pseudodesulfovibrio indicus]
MRILHVGKYAFPHRGGIETFVRDLAVEQVRSGHEVTVLCHGSAQGGRSGGEVRDGVRTVLARTVATVGFAPLSPSFPRLLHSLVRQGGFDVVHLHLPNPAVLFHRLVPRALPLVVHWHADADTAPGLAPRILYPAYSRFERDCLVRADRIVATSPPYLDSSPALAGFRPKCAVIPLGIDPARYPEPAEIEKPRRPLVVGVGRFTFYKGFELLVHAAKLVSAADFVIAGDGPKYAAALRERDRLGLEDRVLLPGEVPDHELHRLLRHASLLCLPSTNRAEAFGMVLLEGMRYGLPLLTTSIPGSGTDWVNLDGVTGRTAPPAAPEALAEIMREMLGSPEALAAMGIASRRRFDERFAIRFAARELEELYGEVVSRC